MKPNVNVNVCGPCQAPSIYKTVVLKPNVVNGKNILTQYMLGPENTKYVIKYDFSISPEVVSGSVNTTAVSHCLNPDYEAAHAAYIAANTAHENNPTAETLAALNAAQARLNGTPQYYYYDPKPVFVKRGQSVRLPKDCVMITLSLDRFFGWEVAPVDGMVYIGSTQSGRHDYSLMYSVTVPRNCILEFDGGSIDDGVIVGQDTLWINVGDVDVWGSNVIREGTWREKQGGAGGGIPDKEYDPEHFSGYGRKTLQLKEDGSNILTQEDFQDEDGNPLTNTIFIISYDFDLDGQEITIPEDCILQFEGGSLNNGTVIFDDTTIVSDYNCFKDVNVQGTVLNDVQVRWFDIDDTGETACSERLQQIFNLGTNKIVFQAGSFAFKHIDLTHSVEVCGEPGTVFIAQPRDEGVNGFEYLFKSTEGETFYFHDFEVTGDTSQLQLVDHHISHPLFWIDSADRVMFDRIFFNQIHNQWVSYNSEDTSEFGSNDVFLLLFFKECQNVTVTNCEFYSCWVGEWIGTYCLEDSPSVRNFKFNNNHIHDYRGGNSFLSINAESVWVCSNKINNVRYDGSMSNIHGNNIYIEGNEISACEAVTVFDTCEWGQMSCKKVTCINNTVECFGSIMLLTSADECVVRNNTHKGISLLQDVSLWSNNPESSIWEGREYEPTKQFSNVEVIGNRADCDYFSLEEGHFYPKDDKRDFRGGVRVLPCYMKGGKITIKDNDIKCNWVDGILLPQDLSIVGDQVRVKSTSIQSRAPITFGLFDDIIVSGNKIDGSLRIAESSTYRCCIHGYIRDGRKSLNTDVIVTSLTIKDNEYTTEGAAWYELIPFLYGPIEINDKNVEYVPEIVDMFYDDRYVPVIGARDGLSIRNFYGETCDLSGACFKINSNNINGQRGLATLDANKVFHLKMPIKRDQHGNTVAPAVDGLFVSRQETSVTRFDSVSDFEYAIEENQETHQQEIVLKTLIPAGSVVSFGEENWQFLYNYYLIDIPVLHTNECAIGDIYNASYDIDLELDGVTTKFKGNLYVRRCRKYQNFVLNLNDEFYHGGTTVGKPNFQVGLSALRRGFSYFDINEKEVIYYTENGWSPYQHGVTRPNGALMPVGFKFFATDLNKPIYAKSITRSGSGTTEDPYVYSVVWAESDGATAGVRRSGTFAQAPAAADIYEGFVYMVNDGANHFPVYAHISGEPATVSWYKADGTQYTGS